MMVDRRRKNQDWFVASQDGSIANVDYIQLAVLMDIRDEVQAIRRRLDCPALWSIPNTLADIRRNTAPRRKRKPNRGKAK